MKIDLSKIDLKLDDLKGHMQRTMAAGLLILIPSAVTIWVLFAVFNTLDAWLGEALALALGIRIPGLGLLITFLLIYGIGIFGSNVAGKKLFSFLEGLMERLPLVRSIYKVAKDISLAFGKREKRPFKEVVALEFPKDGVWTLGFVTVDVPESTPVPKDSVYVFVPTTPNPTSGWLLMLPRKKLMKTPYTIDEASKIIISAGIVGPGITTSEITPKTGIKIISSPKN